MLEKSTDAATTIKLTVSALLPRRRHEFCLAHTLRKGSPRPLG